MNYYIIESLIRIFSNFNCLEILSCESIPVIKYATFKIRSNFLEHDYLIYDCLPGYDLVRGDRTRLCNLNGKWRGHDIECLSKIIFNIPRVDLKLELFRSGKRKTM